MTTNQLPPKKFTGGEYEEIRPLGEGGFARVYLVEDNLGQQWALKQIKPEIIAKDPKILERFAREAQIQANLSHPNIAQVHSFNDQEGYLIIKYIEGRTLRDLLDDDYPGGMDLYTALEILRPIEEALTYIKDAGFAHLDVTPRNILIQETQTLLGRTKRHVVLADFGLARVIDSDGWADLSMFAGAPGYWSPEQRGPTKDKPGTRSDVYSLGLVIGVMLTGRKAQEVLDILRGTSNTLPPTLPPEVKQVLQRATDEKPENRYASVRGLVNDFTGAVEEARTRTLSSTIPAPWPTYKKYPPNPPNQSPWGKLLDLAGAILSKKLSGLIGAVLRKKPPLLFAIARTVLEKDDRASVGKDYTIQAGIAQNRPTLFTGAPFNLPGQSRTDPIEFDLVLHTSDNIEADEETWHQRLLYDPRNANPQLVTFSFHFTTPGSGILAINFYHERRWLKTIRFEIETIEQPVVNAATTTD